jgi:hypothetical protein
MHLFEEVLVELDGRLLDLGREILESLLIRKEESAEILHEVSPEPAVVVQESHAIP